MIDRENMAKRVYLKEASMQLVEPFQQVVKIAMQRVREGEIDKNGIQKVALFHEASRRLYEVSDVEVKKEGFLFGRRVVSVEPLHNGLFIYGFQFTRDGKQVDPLEGIQLPRSVDLTTQQNLFGERDCRPEDARRLARELQEAKKVTLDEYDRAREMYLEKMRRKGFV